MMLDLENTEKVLFTKNSKSLLAKLMSEEDITIQHRNVQTASFDVINRILIVPIWKSMSSDLYDLFMGHEVGHALYTPNDEDILEDAINRSNKDFVNVVEDARIEKKMKKRFPGLRGPMFRAYQELQDADFFGIQNRELSSLSFIDRINVFYKSSMSDATAKSVFSDEELYFVNKVGKTETFSEVASVAQEIFEWLQENSEQQSEQESSTSNMFEMNDDGDIEMSLPSDFQLDQEDQEENQTDGSGTDDGDSEETSDSESGDSNGGNESEDSNEDNGSEDSAEGNGSESSNEDNGSQGSNEDNAVTDSKTGSSGESSKVDEFVSITDSNLTENQKSFVDDQATLEQSNFTIGDIDLKKHVMTINDYQMRIQACQNEFFANNFNQTYSSDKKNLYKDVCSEHSKNINYLVKEFEMKKSAEAYARTYQAKSGNINTSKLWSYQVNEDIFKKKNVTPDGKNHGMVMVVDWSGSMYGQLYKTVVQTIILATFCRRVGIPFDVYNFSDQKRITPEMKKDFYEEIESGQSHGKTIISPSAMLMHTLSSSQKKSDFQKACNAYLFHAWLIEYGYGHISDSELSLGGTPLNNSLLILDKVIHQFKMKHGVEKTSFIVLSDGCAGDQIEYITNNIDRHGKSYGYKNRVSDGYGYSRRKSNVNVVYHERSKQTFVWTTGNRAKDPAARNSTEFLVEMLSKVHDASSVGFFICNSNNELNIAIRSYVFRNQDGWYVPKQELSAVRSKIRKEGFVSAEDCGFDDYYIIDMRTQNNEDELSVDSNMTKAKVASQFSKFQKGKKTTRALLNKFVDNIK